MRKQINFSCMYKMSPVVKRYYEVWHKNANKQLQHPNDWGRFYFFVSIALKFPGKYKKDGVWLKKHLTQDCPEFGEEEIARLASLFDRLKDFYYINRSSASVHQWNKIEKESGQKMIPIS